MIPKSLWGIIGLILVLALFVSSFTGKDIETVTPVTDVNTYNTGDLGVLGTAGLLASIVPNIIGTLVNAFLSLILVFTYLPVQFQVILTLLILAGIIAFIKVIWSTEQ